MLDIISNLITCMSISIQKTTTTKSYYFIFKSFSVSVAIEIIFAVPFILLALGIDGLGTEFTYLGLITAFISQIPKRFVWRYRPWMVQRANKVS